MDEVLSQTFAPPRDVVRCALDDCPRWPRSCPLCRLPWPVVPGGPGMLLSGSGCLSFRSITATASVGQMIGPRANIVTILPVFCEAENILSAAEPGCPPAVRSAA